jgi:hypothetical protein
MVGFFVFNGVMFFDMLEIWSQELLGVAAGLSPRNREI